MGRIRVRVQPGAKRDELVGLLEEVPHIKLAAPPVEGRANKSLMRFLSDLLDVPKQSIRVVTGTSSRDKLVEVEDLGKDEILGRLKQHLPDG